MEPFNEPAVAGGSIKPRVERSATLGVSGKISKPVKRATEVGAEHSVARFRGLVITRSRNPGLRCAPPWALRCRLLPQAR